MAGRPWRELFPNGRTVYFEGDDPEGFRQEISAKHGFDPRESVPPPDDGLGGWAPSWDEHRAFQCPPEHLDAIYASDLWPTGS